MITSFLIEKKFLVFQMITTPYFSKERKSLNTEEGRLFQAEKGLLCFQEKIGKISCFESTKPYSVNRKYQE
ncbi:MAG: hypothetical protein DLD55_03335 [candidate division SR1 bacterium]|nr:MAG: hypothetical protein DLD55_03335 [candidate division SR1 bacterium]